MRYGIPYKGSKNAIIPDLIKAIPHHGYDCFVDLFAGGCSVTHAMMLKQWCPRQIANDLDGKGVELFRRAVSGEYHNETRWISRDDFFRLKGTDPYVTLCWSFGNNAQDYLYSREIEPYKKACHYAIVMDDWTSLRELCPEVWHTAHDALCGITDTHERRIKFGPSIVRWLKANGTAEMNDGNPLYRSCHVRKDTKTRLEGTFRDLQSLQSLESLQSLQRLERLQSLESLQSLQRLERLQSLESLQSLQRLERLQSLESLQRLESKSRITYSKLDYRQVETPSNSVVYCDIPYKGTDGYNCKRGTNPFDHEAFYDWCAVQASMVVISEYSMPEDRFTCVWQRAHLSRISATASNPITECLFVPKGREAEYYKSINSTQQPSLFDSL